MSCGVRVVYGVCGSCVFVVVVLVVVVVAVVVVACQFVAVVLAVVVACLWYATGGRPPTVARHCPRRECVSLVPEARMCLFDRLLH